VTLADLSHDPTTAPLARLLATALAAADDPAWSRAVPPLDASQLADGLPLLHRTAITLDPARAADLLDQLKPARLDPLALIEATIVQSTERIVTLAESADLDADVLAIVGHALSLPLLLACGRAAPPHEHWDAAFCPVCAAWPTLAEVRGLDRERWLRCGRCGSGWRFPPGRCPHCAELDHRKLGYLAPAADRDSRRAETCDTCHAYLKAITVFAPTAPTGLAVLDLETLELDVAAIERGYGRPSEPAFPLELRVLASSR
jgi:FdhE protein